MQQTLHRPAMGVAADDDVLDAESRHGVLDGRCFPSMARTMRRDDVPGIAKDEEIAGLCLRQHGWDDARVGTGDEQGFGVLALRQLLKQPLQRNEILGLELMDSFNQFLHDRPLESTNPDRHQQRMPLAPSRGSGW